MVPDDAACYAALIARDARFDGRLFVGVSSTGIYCRPICRVRTPKAENCRFFSSAAAAEDAGYRPCLRCRPELAPGLATSDPVSRLAWVATQRLEADGEAGLATLAARLGVSERHLRRAFQAEFGVAPVAWLQTQRLLLAKRLLTDTRLPLTEVAFAAGFGSLRRFNALFKTRYGLAPSRLREGALPPDAAAPCFELAYRPPLDWPRMLAFLAGRCIAGVEEVSDLRYRRTVSVDTPQGAVCGWVEVALSPARATLVVQVAPELLRGLPAVLAGVRRLFDLGCDPVPILAVLGPLAADAPGLRVPGCFNGFEMAVRAILGQQVTVKAAHTIAGRLVAALGTPMATPFEALTHRFPEATTLAAADEALLGSLGIVRQRGGAIIALARAVGEGRLDLAPSADVEASIASLRTISGIGPWTAQYIAMRALAWPDAWPSGDVALIKSLRAATAREADRMAAAWSPWRAYATLHCWRRLSEPLPESAR
ncbi:AlkA N-terminal domain-containing protein [Niveibacterium sp. SC-1]|uniref:AlkA N-terminal domain-containing protein n=1 Tax=Niveibacterium sp. SC-1 TaxID=3135646 RepID=UPI00311E07D8